jgi:hypothetical protein
MSAPVDVLAVLRAARDSVPADQLIACCDAVAAVAELIEKATAAAESSCPCSVCAELRAALAHVQGDQS